MQGISFEERKMARFFGFWTLLIFIVLCLGCKRQTRHYVIGVSQCSADIWREKQNAELRMGTYFQDGVELRFAAAYDSDERQVEQIDSLVNIGIDLLIVAPNQVQTISPAIDRAYEQGIPVIVFERKTNSQKFTAFMSADNYEMGRQMGDYIGKRLGGRGQVLEVMGLKGSSPAIERHNGFADALKQYDGIKIVETLQGDWTEQTAYNIVREWKEKNEGERIDLVFGMNDRSATGARRAMMEMGDSAVLYCGIDGLPGENGGIRLVRDSILDASFIYPTYGDSLLQLAVDILDGKPYKKEVKMMSAMVTHDNARVLLIQTDETLRQVARLDELHEKVNSYMQQLHNQRTINWLTWGVVVLLVTVIILLYLYRTGKIMMRRERMVNTLWNLNAEDIQTSKGNGEQKSMEEAQTSLFVSRFKSVVEARLDDCNLSVEDLASDMNLSRVQLYRKVKAVTGASPVELLRAARLNKAYKLLLTTDKSVSEISYMVGFTAPSYFTKCFKEEYGVLPGDVRN